MKELKGFIKGLKRLDNLLKEVDNIGIKELGCVFFEEMDFVSRNDENIWIYALV